VEEVVVEFSFDAALWLSRAVVLVLGALAILTFDATVGSRATWAIGRRCIA
jgi:hypothetical protein